jgi:proton translocating ATP synthase F1 alpha subunit
LEGHLRLIRGYVDSIKDGICIISGLPRVKAGEIIYISKGFDFNFSPTFKGNTFRQDLCKNKQIERAAKFSERYVKALVLNLNRGYIGAMVLGNDRLVYQGSFVFRTKKLLKIKTSLAFFGHVLNSLGEPIDDEDSGCFARSKRKGTVKQIRIVFLRDNKNIRKIRLEGEDFVEKKATGIIDRIPVRVPLLTGLTSVDSLVPIGRGQRELIIGDKQTGKSSVAIDAILNHVSLNNHYLGLDVIKKDANVKFSNPSNISPAHIQISLQELRNIVWFVYCGIGQKQSTISGIRNKLQNKNASWYTAVISATSAESAPLQFIAPYSASTLGEFIRDKIGGSCVVIFDDLSKHAVAYRQMSLLLRRPPGREAFPGDVFYVHSRLLERAGALVDKEVNINMMHGILPSCKNVVLKRGTLTAFPIIETQAGDVSAYIPTNVISITDGQIFLETELFYRGIRPAINVGLSVSRVGSAAQPSLMKTISGSLKMELAQFREIEGFAKLGANLDEHTKRLLTRGENLIEVLKQDIHNPLSTFIQILSIFAGVGFTGKILSKLFQFRKYVTSSPFNNTSVSVKVPSQFLFNSRLISVSWLELFRMRSTDFVLADVRLFLHGLVSFVTKTGITKLFQYKSVYDLSDKLISKIPFSFLNDIVLLYLTEYGSLLVKPYISKAKNSPFHTNTSANFIWLESFLIPKSRVDEINVTEHSDNRNIEDTTAGGNEIDSYLESSDALPILFHSIGDSLSQFLLKKMSKLSNGVNKAKELVRKSASDKDFFTLLSKQKKGRNEIEYFFSKQTDLISNIYTKDYSSREEVEDRLDFDLNLSNLNHFFADVSSLKTLGKKEVESDLLSLKNRIIKTVFRSVFISLDRIGSFYSTKGGNRFFSNSTYSIKEAESIKNKTLALGPENIIYHNWNKNQLKLFKIGSSIQLETSSAIIRKQVSLLDRFSKFLNLREAVSLTI